MPPNCKRESDSAYDIALYINLPLGVNSALTMQRVTYSVKNHQ